jgi:membrane protein
VSPTRILGGLGWKELGTRVLKQVDKDDVFGRAAQLSFYFLLALFPLLLFLTVLLGYVAESGTRMRDSLLSYLSTLLPVSASDLVYTTVDDITKAKGGGKLSFGILAALWASSTGMAALIRSLNAAYNVEEARPWWKQRLVSIGLTIALAVLIISALTLLLTGEGIGEMIAGSFGLGYAFTMTWKIVQWPLVLAFALLSFDLAYYFAPNLKDQDWKWLTPGAVVGVLLWLLISFAFRGYLRFFNTYSVTYGSLGAVIILMLWFYFTGAAILIGGEVNSEIEAAAKAKSTTENGTTPATRR